MHLVLVTSEHSKNLPVVLNFYNREGVLGGPNTSWLCNEMKVLSGRALVLHNSPGTQPAAY